MSVTLRGRADFAWALRLLERAAAMLKARPKHHHPKPKPSAIPGCDYVAGPPIAALRKAGIRFVCRYLSTPGNPKNLTAAEAKKLHAAGIGIVLVFETTGTTALGGLKAGKADAQAAVAQADALGVPAGVPIYFAVDFDMQPSQAAKTVAYIAGASTILGFSRTGVYGGYKVIQAVSEAKACRWFWQCLAWSGGVWHPANHIEQYAAGAHIGGASVDLDRATKLAFGAWMPK